MPYTMCPVCGSLSHVNVSDIEAWTQNHGARGPVPAKCFLCWPDLEPDCLVEIRGSRAAPGAVPGTRGRLIRVILGAQDSGALYEVELEGAEARSALFIRADLKVAS